MTGKATKGGGRGALRVRVRAKDLTLTAADRDVWAAIERDVLDGNNVADATIQLVSAGALDVTLEPVPVDA